MNIKRFSLHFSWSFATACAVALLGTAHPSQAQMSDVTGGLITGSGLTDVSGSIITTSGTSGGAYIPSGRGRTEFAYRNSDIASAVREAAQALNNQLAAGTVPIITTGVAQEGLSRNLQQALANLLTGTGDVEASANQLRSALINVVGSANTTVVENLINSLRGLTAGGNVNPRQLLVAIQAYNALINVSGVELLTNPTEELLGIQSVLGTLLRAAFAAAG